MKREGRQHGVVRSYPILPFDPLSLEHQTERRHVKTVDSALVKGIFTKVSRKPTNQSKFTGKCSKAQCLGCHIHPATKSKDKTKGTMKMRSIGSDHGGVGYPVGTSATGVLAHLAGDRSHDDDGSEDYDYGVTDDDCYYYYDDDNDVYDYDVETTIGLTANEEEEDVRSVKEDEYLSYCDVGLCWGDWDDLYVGDDGWYLVGHSQ